MPPGDNTDSQASDSSDTTQEQDTDQNRVEIDESAIQKQSMDAARNDTTLRQELAKEYGVDPSEIRFETGDGGVEAYAVGGGQQQPAATGEQLTPEELAGDLPKGGVPVRSGSRTITAREKARMNDGKGIVGEIVEDSKGVVRFGQEQIVDPVASGTGKVVSAPVAAADFVIPGDQSGATQFTRSATRKVVEGGGDAAVSVTAGAPVIAASAGQTGKEAAAFAVENPTEAPGAAAGATYDFVKGEAEQAINNPFRFAGSLAAGAGIGKVASKAVPDSVAAKTPTARDAAAKAKSAAGSGRGAVSDAVAATRLRQFARDTRGQTGMFKGRGKSKGKSTGSTDSDLPTDISGTRPDVGEGNRLPDGPGGPDVDTTTGTRGRGGGKQNRRGSKTKSDDSDPTTSDDFADKPDDFDDVKIDPQTGKVVGPDASGGVPASVLAERLGVAAGTLVDQTPTPTTPQDETQPVGGKEDTKPPDTSPDSGPTPPLDTTPPGGDTDDPPGTGTEPPDTDTDTRDTTPTGGPVPPFSEDRDATETGTDAPQPDGRTKADKAVLRGVERRQAQAQRRTVDFGTPTDLDPQQTTETRALSKGGALNLARQAERQQLSEGQGAVPGSQQDSGLDVTPTQIEDQDTGQPQIQEPTPTQDDDQELTTLQTPTTPTPERTPTTPAKPPGDGPPRTPRPRPEIDDVVPVVDDPQPRRDKTKSDVFDNPVVDPATALDFDVGDLI